jgi:hypothetical protein
MTKADIILIVGLAILSLISAAAPQIAALPWFTDRPGYRRLMIGAGLAAGRLKQAIPVGTTAAQAQVLISAEADKLSVKYADSIKAAGFTPADVVSTVEGLTKGQLPAGHIIVDALPALVQDEPQIQAAIAELSALIETHTAAVKAATVRPLLPPVA